MKTNLLWAGILAISSFLSLPAIAAEPVSVLDQVKQRGKLVIGVDPSAPPMAQIGADGKSVGFAPDLARAVAKELNVSVEFKPISGSVQIPSINNGDIDAMFGSTTPTVKREQVLDFTIVYNWDYVVPLVRAGDSGDIKTYTPPRRVSTSKNNYAAQLFKDLVPTGQVTFFDNYSDAVEALRSNQTDAVLLNSFSAKAYAKRYGDSLKIGEAFFTDPQAIIVRQNDSLWRNYLNHTIQKIWARGEFAELYEKHFGYKPEFTIWSQYRLQPGIEN
ncbi:ABC transporter substrate-binding protein [Pseudomonas cichorii]|uniref:substrate-binding periplasmic protein n=1 Tax=Pseudomonas cichorii TaxID=36746 RepID=UPI001C8A28D5|nr:ABC transporter substrate-binding protein [Pseudomonas cichorii]MBX8576975.1 transporter substrate-binding domain-containing protein [Pseudomonas cichorii]